jgi:hypothetical protein
VEQTYTIYRRDVSRRVAAPAPAHLIVIALATIVVWALSHPAGTPAWTQAKHTTTASIPLRPRSATSVLVLNGSGTAGAASDTATRLLTRGYRSAFAADAQVMTYARSLILFRRGWAGEAERLAKDARIRAVAPLDGKLPAGNSRYPLVAIVGH